MRKTVSERFWAKVRKTDYCWLWTAYKVDAGYGQFWDGTRKVLAHRVSFILEHGYVPKEQIDHRCHNKSCVRPEHLRLASQKQNAENRPKPPAHNKSGVRGVSWDSRAGKWRGTVKHNGKQVLSRIYPTLDEAEAAVIAKRNEVFTHNDADRLMV